jgi:hypothetical protein
VARGRGVLGARVDLGQGEGRACRPLDASQAAAVTAALARLSRASDSGLAAAALWRYKVRRKPSKRFSSRSAVGACGTVARRVRSVGLR